MIGCMVTTITLIRRNPKWSTCSSSLAWAYTFVTVSTTMHPWMRALAFVFRSSNGPCLGFYRLLVSVAVKECGAAHLPIVAVVVRVRPIQRLPTGALRPASIHTPSTPQTERTESREAPHTANPDLRESEKNERIFPISWNHLRIKSIKW
jgi:hypothetical protein